MFIMLGFILVFFSLLCLKVVERKLTENFFGVSSQIEIKNYIIWLARAITGLEKQNMRQEYVTLTNKNSYFANRLAF